MSKQILILSVSAGAGHVRAAQAVEAAASRDAQLSSHSRRPADTGTRRISASSTASSTSSWSRSCRSSGPISTRSRIVRAATPWSASSSGRRRSSTRASSTPRSSGSRRTPSCARTSCRRSCCRGRKPRQGQEAPAALGPGDRLRRACALGASARGPLLRRQRGSGIPAGGPRRAAREDLGHRHPRDAAVHRAARARRVRARAGRFARQVHRAHDGRRRRCGRSRRSRCAVAAAARRSAVDRAGGPQRRSAEAAAETGEARIPASCFRWASPPPSSA